MNEKYIKIEACRGNVVQTLEFPESKTKLNRFRWLLVKLLAPVKIKWYE